MRTLLFALLMLSGTALWAPSIAQAQYTNQQFGIEAGYQFIEDDLGLNVHAPAFGLRAGYKADDHSWFTARTLLSFRDDVLPRERTILVFNLTPLDYRYYFLTDSFRPFLGAQTAFQFIANAETGTSTVQWGFGPVGGVEFKLARKLFLGIQLDGLYMVAFGADSIEVFQANTQLLFFL